MVLVFLGSSCTKELDLESDTFHAVKAFEKSSNAKADCGDMADCEGMLVRLEGKIDGDNINRDTRTFWLNDKETPKYTIEIRVEESISDAVFDVLEVSGGKVARVMGIAEGFDKPTNYTCEREIYLVLLDPANVQIMN